MYVFISTLRVIRSEGSLVDHRFQDVQKNFGKVAAKRTALDFICQSGEQRGVADIKAEQKTTECNKTGLPAQADFFDDFLFGRLVNWTNSDRRKWD